MARMKGFEPSYSDVTGRRLTPLSYIPVMEDPVGFEPTTSGFRAQRILPVVLRIYCGSPNRNRTDDLPRIRRLLYLPSYGTVARGGIEPPTRWASTSRSTSELPSQYSKYVI